MRHVKQSYCAARAERGECQSCGTKLHEDYKKKSCFDCLLKMSQRYWAKKQQKKTSKNETEIATEK